MTHPLVSPLVGHRAAETPREASGSCVGRKTHSKEGAGISLSSPPGHQKRFKRLGGGEALLAFLYGFLFLHIPNKGALRH